jgi:excisionase family DNA binding protein
MSTGDYSPSTHDAPLELEAATTEPARPPEAGSEVEGLTVAEAASAYGLSTSSVRRLLSSGKLTAPKVPSPKGMEYRIAPASMEALGYKAKRTLSGVVVTEARANLELEQEITAHTETKRTLELEQVRREAAEKEASDLRESLASERANNEVLRALIPKELESGKRARWWRK